MHPKQVSNHHENKSRCSLIRDKRKPRVFVNDPSIHAHRLLTRNRQTSFLFVIVNFLFRSNVFNSQRNAISADVVIQKSPLLSTEISFTGVVCPFNQATNSFLSTMIENYTISETKSSRELTSIETFHSKVRHCNQEFRWISKIECHCRATGSSSMNKFKSEAIHDRNNRQQQCQHSLISNQIEEINIATLVNSQ